MRNSANHSIAISIHDDPADDPDTSSSSDDEGHGHVSTTSTSYLQLPSWMLAILRTAVSRDDRLPAAGLAAPSTRHHRHSNAAIAPSQPTQDTSTSSWQGLHHQQHHHHQHHDAASSAARRGGARLQVAPSFPRAESDAGSSDASTASRPSPSSALPTLEEGIAAALLQPHGSSWDAAGNVVLPSPAAADGAAAAATAAAAAAADGGTGPTDAPSTAAAAEQHRLQDGGVINVQTITGWLEHTTPFWLLLAFVFGYRYFSGVLIVTWLLGALLQSNASLRKQVALKSNWQPFQVIHMTCYVLATLFLASWAAASIHPWHYLALWPPSTALTVSEAFFVVLVVDMLARFLGMLPKIAVLLFCQLRPGGGTGRALRQQGRMFTALEHAALLYHTLLPIGPWYSCFLKAVPHPLVASTLAGVYLTLKGHSVVKRVKLVVLAARMVSRRGAVYGTYAGRDDIEAAGGCCPICQDPIATGVRLECGHVFCEEDISEWLERERTCPMCRADVKPPGMTSYSDGGCSILPLLF